MTIQVEDESADQGLRRKKDWHYATELDDFNWLSWLCQCITSQKYVQNRSRHLLGNKQYNS